MIPGVIWLILILNATLHTSQPCHFRDDACYQLLDQPHFERWLGSIIIFLINSFAGLLYLVLSFSQTLSVCILWSSCPLLSTEPLFLLWAYHIWTLLCWGKFLFYAHFFGVLIINGCWSLSRPFSASIEIIIWFLSFNFLIWYITLIDLCILKNLCIPGINPTWPWCMSYLMCYWFLFARILLRIFTSMFISDIGL